MEIDKQYASRVIIYKKLLMVFVEVNTQLCTQYSNGRGLGRPQYATGMYTVRKKSVFWYAEIKYGIEITK